MFTSVFSKFSNNIAVIWQSAVEHQDKYTYKEVIEASQTVKREIEGFLDKTCSQNVGVVPTHSAVIVPIILGILDANATFCCLDVNQSPNQLKDSVRLLRCNNIVIAPKSIISSKLTTGEIDEPQHNDLEDGGDLFQSTKTMFCCSTSGTTGNPKIIRVPFKCIMPNVTSLSKHYSVTQSDVIYISSPPTFDPFVLDLCLALFNGAAILMVSNDIRLSANILQTSLQPNAVTIIQITPSLFRRTIGNQLVSSSSSLRCVIFGGESFPSAEDVALWFNWVSEVGTRIRLFNIYGVTEVSCWSTIYEISLTDIQQKHLIPIGEPLDQYTKLRVVDCVTKEVTQNGSGELFIESKIRKCIIDGKDVTNGAMSVATGDLVEIKSGTIYYKTRLDNIVKVYGRKVNLTKIENVTKQLHSSIKDVCCVFDRDHNLLNLFVQIEDESQFTKKDILRELRFKLLDQEIPNEVFVVDEFPLSCHGKISKNKLLESIKNNREHCSILDYLIKKFEENLPDYKSDRTQTESFLSAGGNSILALQIVNELENRFQLIDSELITKLLTGDASIGSILNHFKDSKPVLGDLVVNDTMTQSSISSSWSHNMTKCIDASPTICRIDNRNIVSVGSHSHLLMNVDIGSGDIISKLKLPDRIEGQVVQYKDYGIVGCYDGFVYSIDLCRGAEEWKFDSGGMVKSKIQLAKKFVVFGNYNSESNLWCLRANDGVFIWNKKIGEKSIYADVEVLDNNLFVATLDGTCTKVDLLTGTTLWETKFESPIFSTPKCLDATLIVAEVLGMVHCVDVTNGNILRSYKAAGNIYSSLESNGENLIYFGCYDKSVYCLSVDRNMFRLMWKVATPGQVFSTPKHFVHGSLKLLLSFTTNGYMCLINEIGEILKQFKVDGEIFSSPAVHQGRVVIGSRNNLLLCFEIDRMLKNS